MEKRIMTNKTLIASGMVLVLGSGLSPSGYTSLSSIYIKGKLKNITAAEVTDIIIAALRAGKGLIRIKQELNRRREP